MDRRDWLRGMLTWAGAELVLRSLGPVSFVAGVSAATQTQATQDLRQVVEQALAAAGGAERLAKLKAQTWRSKIRQVQEDPVVETETRYAVEWPDKLRTERADGVTVVREGNRGWTRKEGQVLELVGDQLLFLKEDMWINSLRTLLPLRDPEARLQTVPEVAVDGRPTIGMRVSIKGHRDVVLLFDKETLLLAKAEYRSRGLSEPGKLQVIEAFFSDYREVSGTQVPGLVLISRAGEPFLEIENFDIERLEKLDRKQFLDIGQSSEPAPEPSSTPRESPPQ